MEVENIFSLPLSKLTALHERLDEFFLTRLLAQIPQIGKETDKYYLLNNSLTLSNQDNEDSITIFNNFVMFSQRKCQLLQLMK